MEKMTRMSKYKELRDSLKNDVVTNDETKNYVVNEEIIKDASYYRNLVGETTSNEQKVELQQAHTEDTLHESLTFETITENEPEEVKSAIERVRINSGLDQFNTRMDILNKIRQSKVEITESNVAEEETEVEEIEEVKSLKEEIEAKVQESSNESMFDDIEEEQEEVEEDQRKKRFGLFKKKESIEEVEETEEETEEYEEEEEEEESSFMVKLLNGCIIVLSLVLLGLVIFIAKEFIL